jgi:hypothetical protein
MVSRSIISIFLKPNMKNLSKHVTKATTKIADNFFPTQSWYVPVPVILHSIVSLPICRIMKYGRKFEDCITARLGEERGTGTYCYYKDFMIYGA